MSRETLEWLNKNVLVGFTEKRGHAWHYRAGSGNHYEGPVPVHHVEKLFDFEVEEVPILVPAHPGYEGPDFTDLSLPEPPAGYEYDHSRKAIRRRETGRIFDVTGQDWTPHLFGEWLINNVANLLDDDLQIGTAGLLDGGGKAWVQVERPENVTFAGGVIARPFLLASTALSRRLSTTYGLSVTNTVCDNTMDIAMTEHGGFRMKIRHSKKSLDKIQDVRDALGIVHEASDDFGRQVEELLNVEVHGMRFDKLVREEFPIERDAPKATVTKANARRQAVWDLWNYDERVTPWRGTGYGAWQAFNTYYQHETPIRKSTVRVEKNAKAMISGDLAKIDARILERIGALA